MFRFHKKHKGFTIIQLVIAMVIFTILTGIAFFGGSVYINQARKSDAISSLNTYETAINTAISYHKAECVDGSFDISLLNRYINADYKVPGEETETEGKTEGESERTDEWGTPYYIKLDPAQRDSVSGYHKQFYFDVVCSGKDKQIGTDDDLMLVVQYADGLVNAQIMKDHAYNGGEVPFAE